MKAKTCLVWPVAALLAVLATFGVHAQPTQQPVQSVSVYGVIDTGVERLTNVGPARAALTRMPTLTGALPSRLGFRGAEDLGGGLWSQFVLETGIAPDSGLINQGGRAFGRQAFVGLTDVRWGTLSLGRQYDNFYLALVDAGVFGPNAYGLSSLDPYISAARFDNALSYLGQFGPLGVGASFSLGRDVVPAASGTVCAGESATDHQECRAWSAMVKYTTGSWGVASGFSRLHGAPGAAAGLTSSDRYDDRLTINGFYRADSFKVGLGVIRRDNNGNRAQPRSLLRWIEASYKVTPALALEAQLSRLGYEGSATGDRSTLFAVRALYSLSKRTAVYATAGRMQNHGAQNLSVSATAPGGNPLPGAGQSGLLLGVRTSF